MASPAANSSSVRPPERTTQVSCTALAADGGVRARQLAALAALIQRAKELKQQ